MITEFSTLPKKLYYVQTAEDCTVLDADGDTLAEISAPGGYFPGIGAPDASTGTVTFSPAVKRVIGPFDLAPQLQLTLLGLLGGNDYTLPDGYKRVEFLEKEKRAYVNLPCELNAESLYFGVKYMTYVNDTGQTTFILYNSDWTHSRIVGIQDGYSRLTVRFVDAQNKWTHDYFTVDASQPLNVTTWPLKGEIQTNRVASQLSFNMRGMSTNTLRIGSDGTDTYGLKGRIYDIVIGDDGGLQMHLIPCVDEVGAPCFRDVVNNVTYYSSGSQDFIVPDSAAPVTTFSRRLPITYAQLTEHGVCRLYCVPRGYNGTKEEYAAEHGFKPIVETEEPAEGYWEPNWRETTEEIVLDWVEAAQLVELENA